MFNDCLPCKAETIWLTFFSTEDNLQIQKQLFHFEKGKNYVTQKQ